MRYVSITEWRDLESGHLYHAGDPFPYDKQDIPEERIAALCSSQNKAGFALIQAAINMPMLLLLLFVL